MTFPNEAPENSARNSASNCGKNGNWERPGTPHFQLYPNLARIQRIDIFCFQKALFVQFEPSVASTNSTFLEKVITFLSEDPSSVAASSSLERIVEATAVEENITVNSETDSVDTNAAVVFEPVVKMKKSLEKRRAAEMAQGHLIHQTRRERQSTEN